MDLMDDRKPLNPHEGGNLKDYVDAPISALEAIGIEMSQSPWSDGLNEWMGEYLSKSGAPPFSFGYD